MTIQENPSNDWIKILLKKAVSEAAIAVLSPTHQPHRNSCSKMVTEVFVRPPINEKAFPLGVTVHMNGGPLISTVHEFPALLRTCRGKYLRYHNQRILFPQSISNPKESCCSSLSFGKISWIQTSHQGLCSDKGLFNY